jgi:hypothetical protein
MSTSKNPHESKLGYRFERPESSHTLGSSRFEVYINENPTEHHFDPEKLHLHIKSKTSVIESLTVRHPWFFEHTYQALAGSVELTDRHGKEVEAFTFGGSLKIESHDTLTVCILESPAPILEISVKDPILRMFIEETEILFAKRRASLLSQPHAYDEQLMNVDPFILYQATLNALIDDFEHSHHKEDPNINEFLNFLHAERKRLEGEDKAPHLMPALKDIL